jgi:hypothetical protein
MTSNMPRTLNFRRDESNISPVTRPTALKTVPGSDSLEMPGVHGQVLSQAAARTAGVPPSILMNQRYPCLPAGRRTPLNRHAVVINGTLHGRYGSQSHTYRGEPLPQGEAEISRRKINLLTKAPPSQYAKLAPSTRVPGQLAGESRKGLRGTAISEPSIITRLKSMQGGFVEESIAKSSAVLQSSRKGRRRKEVLLYPTTQTTTADDGTKTTKPLCPMVKLIGPTPPASRVPSMIDTTQTQESAQSQTDARILATEPLIPPRRPHANASSINIPAAATLSIDMTYKAMYEREHQLTSRLQRELMPTKANLDAERQKLAALEEELVVQRAEANQKGKFTNHFKWLYELEKAKTDRLLEQLKQGEESGESGEISHSFETEVDNEVASPVSPETSHRREASAELPCMITTDARRGASTGRHTHHQSPPTIPQRVLRHSTARPRIENIPRMLSHTEEGPGVTYELSAATSHQVLCPSNLGMRIEIQAGSPQRIDELLSSAPHEVPRPISELAEFLADDETFAASQHRYRELLQADEEHEEPASYFSDDSGSDTDSEDEVYELRESPKLPTLLAELAESPSSHFSSPNTDKGGDSDDDLYESPTTPKLPTRPSTPNLSGLPFSDGEESEGSPRAAEAIYRFGPRRVEAVPAVFRVPLSDPEINYKDSETDIAEVAMKMDAWEWCSVPGLELRDPRE